jgi:glycerol-3-phosphate acyltransferase PlsY
MVIPMLLTSLLCFLLGGTPSGLIIGKVWGGKDLRKYGSHNTGATNAFRVLGKLPALLTLLLDVLKGFLPLIILRRFYPEPLLLAACGIAAILGHDFSPYVKFHGGKGVATSLGVFLVLSPVAIIITLILWILVLSVWRIVSLASIMTGVFLPLALLCGGYPKTILFAGILAGLLLIFRHKENIGRLLKGEEKRLGKNQVKSSRV